MAVTHSTTADFYRHHTEHQVAPATPFREAALVSGRQAGKSRILALIAIYLAPMLPNFSEEDGVSGQAPSAVSPNGKS